MKKTTLYILPLALAFAALVSACTSLDCSIDNLVMMNVGIPDTLKADTLTVAALTESGDTDIYTNGTGVTSFTIPLSHGQDADRFLFTFTDTTGSVLSDTVTISKINQAHMESVDCPPQFWHTIQGVTTTHNRLDSISVINTLVDNDLSEENITLHLHPSR